jgi:hypothetical protein
MAFLSCPSGVLPVPQCGLEPALRGLQARGLAVFHRVQLLLGGAVHPPP